MNTGALITGRVVGAVEVERRFESDVPAKAIDRLRKAIRGLGFTLERNVRTSQLNGGVLRRRSGRLARSVNTQFRDTTYTSTSSTGTAVIYGRAWELGFSVPAQVIRARFKAALSWPGARHPVKSVSIPARTEAARPWLRPALQAMRPTIYQTFSTAMRGL